MSNNHEIGNMLNQDRHGSYCSEAHKPLGGRHILKIHWQLNAQKTLSSPWEDGILNSGKWSEVRATLLKNKLNAHTRSRSQYAKRDSGRENKM